MSWPFRNKTGQEGQPLEAPALASIESLVTRHYGFVWRLLRGFGLPPADAEDAAQQVFMIAARKLASLTPDRERSFLYGVSLRVANNARRGLRRRREVPEETDEHGTSDALGPEHSAELGDARRLLADLLARLPEKLRRALVLAEIEGLEVQDIAELEGIPIGTAASRLRLARAQFRELLSAVKERNPFSVDS